MKKVEERDSKWEKRRKEIESEEREKRDRKLGKRKKKIESRERAGKR